MHACCSINYTHTTNTQPTQNQHTIRCTLTLHTHPPGTQIMKYLHSAGLCIAAPRSTLTGPSPAGQPGRGQQQRCCMPCARCCCMPCRSMHTLSLKAMPAAGFGAARSAERAGGQGQHRRRASKQGLLHYVPSYPWGCLLGLGRARQAAADLGITPSVERLVIQHGRLQQGSSGLSALSDIRRGGAGHAAAAAQGSSAGQQRRAGQGVPGCRGGRR
jgi:hypothetical protein